VEQKDVLGERRALCRSVIDRLLKRDIKKSTADFLNPRHMWKGSHTGDQIGIDLGRPNDGHQENKEG
jgi:hypothetical protein